MKFESRIEGGEELEKFLATFPVNVEKKYLKAGLRGPVKKVKARIRNNIKSRFVMRSGVLLRSVKHRAVKTRTGVGLVIETSSLRNETRRIKSTVKRRVKIKKLKSNDKFKDAYYAPFLIRGTKTKSGSQRIKPDDFLDDALESERGASSEQFADSIIKQFDRDATKHLKRGRK